MVCGDFAVKSLSPVAVSLLSSTSRVIPRILTLGGEPSIAESSCWLTFSSRYEFNVVEVKIEVVVLVHAE